MTSQILEGVTEFFLRGYTKNVFIFNFSMKREWIG